MSMRAIFKHAAASLLRLGLGFGLAGPALAEVEWFNYNTSGQNLGTGVWWHQTGWVPGYVVIRSGERLDGEIRKLKRGGNLAEVHIRIKDGKKKRTLKLPLESMRDYGPHVTIDYITKGGKSKRKKAEQNFHPGSVILSDGSEAQGWVSVYDQELRFTPQVDGHVRRFEPADVREAAQTIDGAPLEWIAYRDKFQQRPSAGELAASQGRIELLNGQTLTGPVAMVSGEWYASAANFVGANQRVEKIEASRIKLVTIEQSPPVMYVNFGGMLTRVLADGDAYMLFRNPFPTTENKFLSGLANAMVGTVAVVATAAVAQEAQKQAVENAFEDTMDRTGDAVAAATAGVAAGHQMQRDQVAALSQYERDHDWDPVKIYRTEFVIFNKRNGDAVPVNSSNFDDKAKGALMGCGRYLMMSKREQKKMLKFDELDKMVDFLNTCYQT